MIFSHLLGELRKSITSPNQQTVPVIVTSAGHPLAGALVFLVVRNKKSGQLHVHNGVSADDGACVLSYEPNKETPVYASAMSGSGNWYGASTKWGGTLQIDCPPFEFESNICWWHKALGIEKYEPGRGQGIKIGLVDTGVGPHPYLSHVEDLGAIIDGVKTADGRDVSYHGTMMAGLIGARPSDQTHPAGIAPGAAISSVRVYPKDAHGANANDVAEAIRFLAGDVGVDLINLSLSSDTPSRPQAEAIEYARQKGAFCIAAAGNTGEQPVRYPAAVPGVAAVGALGQKNFHGPTMETNEVFEPVTNLKKGTQGTYLAMVSNFGEGLTCIAPGTAIASTVPSPDGKALYASQVGTSDSVAVVTAVLAARLATDKNYIGMPRNLQRTERAQQTLNAMCQSLGMSALYQGQGKPELGT